MLTAFRSAGIVTVIVVVGSARSQELAPPGSGVSIHKLVIDSAMSRTVKYTVKGGSPRLQALVRRVEWAENELSVIEQLQRLKLDTVLYERHLAAFRTAQLTNPYFPRGTNSLTTNGESVIDQETSLQQALAEQLAYEATPQAALQMIGFLEKMQIELEEQLKALPAPEKKAAQDPIDALRPRLVALSRAEGTPPRSKPAAATPPAARAAFEVEWQGAWYAAEVLQARGGSTRIHYTGWSSSWDEWVPATRIRPAPTLRRLHR